MYDINNTRTEQIKQDKKNIAHACKLPLEFAKLSA